MHDLLTFMGSQGTPPAASARHHDGESNGSHNGESNGSHNGDSNGSHNGESNGNFHAVSVEAPIATQHPAFPDDVATPSSPVELIIPAPPHVSPSPAQPAPAKAAVAAPNGLKEGPPSPASRPAAVSRPAADAADRRRITEQLLGIVSERTGYPEEMLNLDADLEADLGIDSIKRVEIAGTLIRSLELPEGQAPDIEKLTVSRTLGQVVDHLESFINQSCAPAGVGMEDGRHPFDEARTGHGVGRFALKQVLAPPIGATGDLAPGGFVVIVDDEAGVGRRLAVHLNDRGPRVVRVVSGAGKSSSDPDVVTADLRDPEGVDRLVGDLRGRFGRAVALIHLSALRAGGRGAEPGARGWGSRDGDLASLYLLSRALLPDLERAAARGGAAVLAATRMGGDFAVGGSARAFAHEDGALVGFLKTLAHECPSIRIKSVDLEAEEPDVVAGLLAAELTADDGMVEVGYAAGRRIALESTPAPLAGGGGEVPLDRGSVVLVTGGARGITARATLALAEAVPCTFVVVGRTPPPAASEPSETLGIEEPKALKRAIMERMRAEGRPIAVAAVEERYRRLLLERQVRANLERIRQAGARVEYVVCDVSDAEAFGSLIDEVYRVKGRIDGVVHGAGVIEDRLVKDKTPESFARVMAVKAGGARVLAERLRLDSLRFLVFFSSVSGRFGNRGQADYAAASEALNKLAQSLDRRCPGRIVSINWGPWLETGMVSPEVQRQFAERGVTLIPPDVGCRMLVDELRFGRKGDVEILIGGGEPPSTLDPASGRREPAPRAGAASFPLIAVAGALARGEDRIELVRPIDPELDLYLKDHCLDGRPVFPFAMAMELMSEVAATARPDLELLEVCDVRLHRGVVLDGAGEEVRVVARPHAGGEADGPGHAAERTLDVAILGVKDPNRVHYRATVRLGRRAEDHAAAAHFGGVADPGLFEGGELKSLRVEEAYRNFLFHGPLFQGIASIEAFGPRGARAILRPSSPRACLRGGPAGAWLVDPILVDSALQMQVLWARLHWDMTLLPARIGEYRLFGPGVARPATTEDRAAPGLRYELRVSAESRAPTCHADHYFSSLDGRLLGMLTGVEGTGSKALNRLAGTCRR
jgi:NAD(P)-dependent dehydrogenase (short-subunit alcohol dehydrogenase family)